MPDNNRIAEPVAADVPEKKISWLYVLRCNYTLLVTGMMVLTTGSILPFLEKEFGLSYSMRGIFLSLQSVGNLFFVLAGGILADLIGRKNVLLLGALFVITGFGGIALLKPGSMPSGNGGVAALFVLSLISGFGWGANSSVNTVISDYTGGSVRFLNILHIFFAIGAFTAPFLTVLYTSTGVGWRMIPLTIAGLSLIQIIFISTLPMPKPGHRDAMQSPGEGRGARSPAISLAFLKEIRFYIFAFVMVAYVAAECALNGWTVTYFEESGILTADLSQAMLSLMWLTMMAGRLIVSGFMSGLRTEGVILVSAAGAFLCGIALLLANSAASALILMGFVGLFFAGIFPSTVANASFLTKGSATTSGVLLSFSGLGSFVGPFTVGMVSDSFGLKRGMMCVTAFNALLCLAATVNFFVRNRRSAVLLSNHISREQGII